MNRMDSHEEFNNFIENDNEQIPDSVKLYHREMYECFERYLAAVVEHMWVKGFEYAMKLMGVMREE